MVQKIISVKSPKLRIKSKKVTKIDKKVKKIIADMKDTLKAQKDPEGVGLAAPQIGQNLRIFLINYEKQKKVIINPKIIKISKEKGLKEKKEKNLLEGCLSLPHYYGPIKRARKIKIEYLTEDGGQKIEEFTGFFSQIIQHEIDHLNGILFIDRILEQKAPLYQADGGQWEEVELS